MKRYDLVIIGGGAAGFSAMVKFREIVGPDESIAIINSGPLGGTCVNVGCVPSKYLIEAGKTLRTLRAMSSRGVKGEVAIDFGTLMGSLRRFIGELRKSKYESLIEYYGADLYVGNARFKSPRTVEIVGENGTTTVEGRGFIVATGSKPWIPDIRGIDSVEYYTSDTIWSIEKPPSNMLVVGGGAIGVELAQAFARLGSNVDIVEALDRLLPGADPLISKSLEKVLASEGLRIMSKSKVAEVWRRNGRIYARIVGGKGAYTREYDLLLVAAGRTPNTRGLALSRAGIEVDDKGFIKVSKDLRTSNPIAYAAGDVAATPKPAFLETLAAKEGALAAYNLATGSRQHIDYETVPVVVFTDPEIAYVGLSEEKMLKLKGKCSCRVSWFRSLPKSGITGSREGVAKVIVDPDEEVIKGFHVMAPYASEFIGIAALMIKHGYTIKDALETILAFPTSSEIVKTSIQAYLRNPDKMPCCVE